MIKLIKTPKGEHEVKGFMKAGNTVFVTFSEEYSMQDVISAVSDTSKIEYIEDGVSVELANGYTYLNSVSKVTGGFKAALKKENTLLGRVCELESENDKNKAENAALQQQITELQLALVELYEGGLEE